MDIIDRPLQARHLWRAMGALLEGFWTVLRLRSPRRERRAYNPVG
jgi:hypothetical protein